MKVDTEKGIIGNLKSEAIIHKKENIKISGKLIEIDKKIVKLIKVLNKFGIKTKNSCQGEKRGYIALDTKNVEMYLGTVNDTGQLNISLRFPTPK